MPIASQRYPAGETVGLPPWLAAVWDFVRRDPLGGVGPVGMVPSATLARHLPLMARAGSVLGGFQPSSAVGEIVRQLAGVPPAKLLVRPVTGLPTATIARGQSALGDVNAPGILSGSLAPQDFPLYLNRLAPRLIGPTLIEGDIFQKLVTKYLMNALR